MEQRPLSIMNRHKKGTGNKSWPGCGSANRVLPTMYEALGPTSCTIQSGAEIHS